MNVSSKSCKEATDRKIEVPNAKCKTKIGLWNVRTTYEAGKLSQITSEMRCYNLHVLGISESRCTGSGRQKTNTGETALYSGRDNNQHHEGVAIILKEGNDGEMSDGVETCQQPAYEGQGERKTHQHHHHPVLRSN